MTKLTPSPSVPLSFPSSVVWGSNKFAFSYNVFINSLTILHNIFDHTPKLYSGPPSPHNHPISCSFSLFEYAPHAASHTHLKP